MKVMLPRREFRNSSKDSTKGTEQCEEIKPEHEKWINHSTKTDFTCLECLKNFSSKSNLQIHGLIHSGERYHCETCNKCFTQKSNLKRHKTVHLGKKSFPCLLCPRQFSQKSNLYRHQVVVHSGNRNFVCEDCGKKFSQKCNLKKHLEKHAQFLPPVECVLKDESSSCSS